MKGFMIGNFISQADKIVKRNTFRYKFYKEQSPVRSVYQILSYPVNPDNQFEVLYRHPPRLIWNFNNSFFKGFCAVCTAIFVRAYAVHHFYVLPAVSTPSDNVHLALQHEHSKHQIIFKLWPYVAVSSRKCNSEDPLFTQQFIRVPISDGSTHIASGFCA